MARLCSLLAFIGFSLSIYADATPVYDLKPFMGQVGQGQVFLGGKEKDPVGRCSIKISEYRDPQGGYSAISIQYDTAYPEYFFDNAVEAVEKTSREVIYKMQPSADHSGHICGSFAPAKKVTRFLVIAQDRVEIRRTYRCPYFITTSTDSWICHF